jgi:hypothetical protein
MADGDPIIIGQDNTASNPGNQTRLLRNEVTDIGHLFAVLSLNAGSAILGEAREGNGVNAITDTRAGVVSFARSSGTGVLSISNTGDGLYAYTAGQGRSAVTGDNSSNGPGVGVVGTATGFRSIGLRGRGFSFGVEGSTDGGTGVSGFSSRGTGVYGATGDPVNGEGGFFSGGITVVNGNKNFKIDHPLDPENRYLLHTCVESSERKNVYDGVVHLDEEGSAWVDLPEWFEALNGDFRYQLTAVGGPAPNLHVAEEVSENRFKIAGGQEEMKVCWQVTGSRKDPSAAAHPFEVEQEKREEEQGHYLDPSLYDAPEEQRITIGPTAEAVDERIDELRRFGEEQRREMEELRRRREHQ